MLEQKFQCVWLQRETVPKLKPLIVFPDVKREPKALNDEFKAKCVVASSINSLGADISLPQCLDTGIWSRNLEEHREVRRSGTASRGIALLVFSFRMRSLCYHIPRENIRLGQVNRYYSLMAFTSPSLNQHVGISVVWGQQLRITLFTAHLRLFCWILLAWRYRSYCMFSNWLQAVKRTA